MMSAKAASVKASSAAANLWGLSTNETIDDSRKTKMKRCSWTKGANDLRRQRGEGRGMRQAGRWADGRMYGRADRQAGKQACDPPSKDFDDHEYQQPHLFHDGPVPILCPDARMQCVKKKYQY
jgi:hypothetical protein